MKQSILISIGIFLLFVTGVPGNKALAQENGCILKEPVISINFGENKKGPGIDLFALPDYKPEYNSCPIDGHYSFVPYTSDCFNGDWFTMNEDHTPGDEDGNMMLVNASETGGIFFSTTLNNLSGNTTYEFAAWMLNVCRIRGGCPPLPPNINIILKTPARQIIGDYKTGLLGQTYEPHWTRYAGFFTTPPNVTTLLLTMEDKTLGGCGNDFALDDITIRECVKPSPVINPPPAPLVKPVVTRPVVVTKSIEKKTPVNLKQVKSNIPVITTDKNRKDTPEIAVVTKPEIVMAPLPEPILARANPIVKQIETSAGDIRIDLYDNGEIDGDTVSIYHNNELIVSRAGLSDKPISFHVKVDAMYPHHELVMVANNLGSIPPNTSLMIITFKNERTEVFISSSEQKNAKVVIDLKK